MQGFDNKALILFPKETLQYQTNSRYRNMLLQAATNIVKYLRSRGIDPQAFLTDDIAWEFSSLKLHYVSTLTDGDLFFVQRNCDGMQRVMQLDRVQFPEVSDTIARKVELPKGCTTEQRFEIIQKRDKKAVSTIIPMYKIVVHFYKRGQSNYRVAMRPGDGKIRLIIDPSTFMVTTYLSGEEVEASELLQLNCANRALHLWEVDK